MAKRADENKEITVVIEGSGLSAIDVAKTLLRDGKIIQQEDGNFKYQSDPHSEYKIKVVMVSRRGILPLVQMQNNWLYNRDFFDGKSFKYPDGLVVDEQAFQRIATTQGSALRLWQMAIMQSRAMEIAYHEARKHALQKNDEVGAEVAAKKEQEARKFLYHIIANLKKDEGKEMPETEVDKFFNELTGSSDKQLEAISRKFGLQLEGANYDAILSALHEEIGIDEEPFSSVIPRLRQNIHDAKKGDVGGFLVWRAVAFPQFNFLPYIAENEEAYYRIFLRPHIRATEGMPEESAKELLAYHAAGSLDILRLGRDVEKVFFDKNGEEISLKDRQKILDEMRAAKKSEAEIAATLRDEKIIYRDANGHSLSCDIAINATGHSHNIHRNPPPLYCSMLREEIITTKKTLWAKSEAEYAEKKAQLCESFGADSARTLLGFVSKVGDEWIYDSGEINLRNFNALDEKGEILNPEISFLVMGSGGIFGAKHAGKTAAQNLASQPKPHFAPAMAAAPIKHDPQSGIAIRTF